MSLVASILIMAGDMVEIPIAAGKKTSAKSAGPENSTSVVRSGPLH